MPAYRSKGQDYEAVCAFIEWNSKIRAIRTLRRGTTVYCTGTLLKPDEWRELQRFDGKTLPDGSTLKITGIPKNL